MGETVSKFWVCYEVLGQKLRQGPYETFEIAEENCRDIKGFHEQRD